MKGVIRQEEKGNAMGIVLWIVSAVIAIVVVGLFTRGGIEGVVYAIKAFRFTSAPYVATAIVTLVVRFVLFIIQGAVSSRNQSNAIPEDKSTTPAEPISSNHNADGK